MAQELHSLTFPITSGGTTTPTEFSLDYLARKDGVVDTAENLMADTAEDCEFTFRAVSGTGASKTEKVSGNSLVWNQLFSASGDSVAIPEGHKYISKLGTTWTYGTGASGGTTVTSTSATDMLFDVTKMGSYWATKYTTVNAFRADFPKDYYAYNAGVVLNNKTTGIKSVGKNLLNPINILNGYSGSAGQSGTASFIGLNTARTAFISVEAGKTYTRSKGDTHAFNRSNIYLCNEIPTVGESQYWHSLGDTTNTITVPADSTYKYLAWYLGNDYTAGENPLVQIEKGSTATTYSPYTTTTLSLPITTLQGTPSGGSTAEVMFADGMVSVGNVADELLPIGSAVKRFGKVDLGSLTWAYDSGNSRFYSNEIQDAPQGTRNVHSVCSKYECLYSGEPFPSGANGVCYFSTRRIYINDFSYTDPAVFKTAMSGVYLYYELATPTNYTFPPVCDLLQVEDGGTLEQLVPTGTEPTSAPFRGEMRFPITVNKPMIAVPAPTANGTYRLTCTVTNGVVSYSWVSA